jgi:UDP-glucose 4-epimerase
VRVLITGGAGFIGSHLAEAFLARGAAVTVLDASAAGKVAHLLTDRSFDFVQGSVLDRKTVDELVARADLVYHLAAVVGVEHYVTDPLRVLDVNIDGARNVFSACLKHGRRVVFSSTSEVYGKSHAWPFEEYGDRLLGPTSCDRWSYSTSKAIGEHYAFAYAKQGLKATIIRYFNVYGPRLDSDEHGRVLAIWLGQLRRGEPLTVHGDGSQTRCLTYVDDAIRATVAAGVLSAAAGGIFNIGNDREVSMLELAEAVRDAWGLPTSPIKFVPHAEVYGPSYEDIPRRVPDVTRMRDILGVSADVSLAEGLRKTIEWYRSANPSPRPSPARGEGAYAEEQPCLPT